MAEGLEFNSDFPGMRAVTDADYNTRIFGFKVEAQVVRIRKGVEETLRSDRGLRLRGSTVTPGVGVAAV